MPDPTPRMPQAGEAAPDFALPDSTGFTRRLGELVAERAHVLVFYRGHWCAFCSRLMMDYRDRSEALDAAGVGVLALSADAPLVAHEMREGLGLPFTLLCDPERAVIRAWDLHDAKENVAHPATFLVEPDLRVAYARRESFFRRVSPDRMLKFIASHPPAPPSPRLHLPSRASWRWAAGRLSRRDAT